MATNVTVEFALAREEYTKAKTPQEKIVALEKMYAEVPKHKGTENLRMDIKRKLSYWKKQLEVQDRKKSSKSYSIQKDAPTIGIVGLTNTGKTTLFNSLTNCDAKVGNYEFTTMVPNVGMMNYEDVKLEVIDFPPVYENAVVNDSLRIYFSYLRICDLLVVLDSGHLDSIKKEFEKMKIILGKKKKITIKKFNTLVINNANNVKGISYSDLIQLTKENNLRNALIDVGEEMDVNTYLKMIDSSYYFVDYIVEPPFSYDVNEIKKKIWKNMNLIRVYTKDKHGKVGKEPIVLKKGSNVEVLAASIHKDFLRKFKNAKIWGKSAKFDGQSVGLTHVLEDKDVVEINLK